MFTSVSILSMKKKIKWFQEKVFLAETLIHGCGNFFFPLSQNLSLSCSAKKTTQQRKISNAEEFMLLKSPPVVIPPEPWPDFACNQDSLVIFWFLDCCSCLRIPFNLESCLQNSSVNQRNQNIETKRVQFHHHRQIADSPHFQMIIQNILACIYNNKLLKV